ncbi:MAG: RagB/SusD family nutrient uptake outer membrane protein [Bacteroidia bacterium]|nr:RagB/SusD family nutrient uptake outer membrane protein [Bacteroidia bacterium]
MKKYIVILVALVSLSSCRKWLEVYPEGVQLEEEAIKSQDDMVKLLNSCYDAMANQYNGQVQLFNELLGDNLEKPQSGFVVPIYQRTTNFFNSDVGGLYLELYRPVFRINFLIKTLQDKRIPVDAATESRLIAEGKFLRAMCHFDLVRLWAQPYGASADNSHLGIVIRKAPTTDPLPRSSVKEVYDFIIGDLNDAIANLPDNNGNYADKDAARALLAKVYFQMNKFDKVKELCDVVIPNYTMDTTLNRFVNALTSSENIFSFVSSSTQDNRASRFIGNFRIVNPSNPPAFRLSKSLYTEATSDPTDKRAAQYAVFNAGTSTETYGITKFNYDWLSVPMLYLTQLKLMRAEANAKLGVDLPTAIKDVNDVLERAFGSQVNNLPSGAGATQIVNEARKQRRLEFPIEGDRVQDLKRIGALEDPSGATFKIRNSPWNCPGLALQFPVNERTSVFVFNEEGNCE